MVGSKNDTGWKGGHERIVAALRPPAIVPAMSRKFFIAANWKMNAPPSGWDGEDSSYRPHPAIDVFVFPSFLDIPACVSAGFIVGGQHGRPEVAGAFTGDVSMKMLALRGCRAVLCGHSERRKFHRESDADVMAQARAARDAGLMPVICVGETAEERRAGETHDVITRQCASIILPAVIAYEPVWSIGTGNTPTPIEVQEVHAFIRALLSGGERALTRVLYGGSVKAVNADGFLECPDVDGLLVGGASLDRAEFRRIVAAAAARTAG